MPKKDLLKNIKTIPVKLTHGRGYPLLIGSDILFKLPFYLKKYPVSKKAAIITHPQLSDPYAFPLKSILDKAGFTPFVLEVPSGERSKSLKTVSQLLDHLVELKFERGDTILALGGGVIGDLAGFAASIYMRGIPFVQVPTSLLAQVDAAIGGKTGVNHLQGKNLIGTFYQPLFTFIDIHTLNTLPKREMLCGLAEIVKYGIIQDKRLFSFIERHQKTIHDLSISKEGAIWSYLICRSCQNKAKVVAQDEKEKNLREILNFGHTIGHALEAASRYKLYLHGEAVAIGMVAASRIACMLEFFSKDQTRRVETLIHHLGFKTQLKGVKSQAVLEKLTLDKKIKNGKIRFVLPLEIGKVTTRDDISQDVIQNILKELGAA